MALWRYTGLSGSGQTSQDLLMYASRTFNSLLYYLRAQLGAPFSGLRHHGVSDPRSQVDGVFQLKFVVPGNLVPHPPNARNSAFSANRTGGDAHLKRLKHPKKPTLFWKVSIQVSTISSAYPPTNLYPEHHCLTPEALLPSSQSFLYPAHHPTAIHTSHPTLCHSPDKTISTVSSFHVHIRTVLCPVLLPLTNLQPRQLEVIPMFIPNVIHAGRERKFFMRRCVLVAPNLLQLRC